MWLCPVIFLFMFCGGKQDSNAYCITICGIMQRYFGEDGDSLRSTFLIKTSEETPMYFCIANPVSRSGNTGAEARKLQAVLNAQHLPSTICYTKGPGDAGRIAGRIAAEAAEKKEDADIVIFGGDGTINEVVSGISDFRYIRIGIVPVGSGNDMARGLGLPKDNHRLFARIAEGAVQRTIDLGHIHYDRFAGKAARGHNGEIREDIYFANGSGIGYDAAVCEEVNATATKGILNRLGLGKASYGLIALKQLLGVRKTACDIVTDDGREFHFDNVFFACAMNCSHQGGGYCFAPDADPSDGLMNVTVVGNLTKIRALMCFPKAAKGELAGTHGITQFTCRKMKVRTGRPLWVQTDGEVQMQTDAATFEMLQQKIRLIV